MRGIQVNNYFNNHITINGKKISNEGSTILHTQRPKPLVINHAHPELSEPLLLDDTKSPTMKQMTSAQRKKRTNTLVQSKKKSNKKRSISLERLKKGLSSQKKALVSSSSESSKEDQKITIISQKKLKPVYNKNQGLGKRSKSTIIKSSQFQIERNQHQFIKKQTNDKNLSIQPLKKKIKTEKKNKKQTNLLQRSSKNLTKQPSSMIKNKKDKQFLLKLDKSSDKKSARTYAKSGVASSKNSKPVSARDKHPKKKLFSTIQQKKPHFFEELKQKYQNQQILKGVNYINSREEIKGKKDKLKFKINLNEPEKDDEFKKVVQNLQEVLNSVGSKKKLKKQLAILEQKLKVFQEVSSSESESQEQDQNEPEILDSHKETIYNFKRNKHEKSDQDKELEIQEHSLINKYQNSNSLETEIRLNQEKIDQNQNNLEEYYQEALQSSEKIQKQQKQQNYGYLNQNYEEFDENKIFLRVEGKQINDPLLGRRINNNIFNIDSEILDQIEDIKKDQLVKNERKRQIEMLKMFKNESNKMMEKVGLSKDCSENIDKMEEKEDMIEIEASKNMIEIEGSTNIFEIAQRKVQKMDVSKLTIQTSRIEDRYPPIGTLLRSPKFNEQELMGMISLKQKFMTNKHDKMNELVHKMYEKQLVSPKSFEFQMYQLRKKYQEDNEQLESAKKQAEQLSSILSDIRKDKEEIQGLDELLRNEKWSQAHSLMAKNDNKHCYNNDDDWERININKDNNIDNEMEHPNEFQQKQVEVNRKRNNSEVRVQVQNNLTEESEQYVGYINNYYSRGHQNNNNPHQSQPFLREKQFTHTNADKQANHAILTSDLHSKYSEEEDQCIYYHDDEEEEHFVLTQSQKETNQFMKLIQIPTLPQEQKYQLPQNNNQNMCKAISNQEELGNQITTKIGNTIIKIQTNEEDELLESADNGEDEKFQKNNSGLISNQSNGSSANKEKKGFDSNLYFIKEYCIALCEYVRDNNDHKEYFKQNISSMIQFDLNALLKLFQGGVREESLTIGVKRKAKNNAISRPIFDNFNQSYEGLRYIKSKLDKDQLDKELQEIFLISIFDALNESLNYERPGSINGKPLPWYNDAKHLKNLKYTKIGMETDFEQDNTESYDLIFGVAIARIIQWGSCLCGFLPDTVELQNTQIDDEYVNHIRETRMAFLLEKMMAQEEGLMANMELECLEVYTKVAELVYQDIAEECAQQLNQVIIKQL